MLRKKKSEIVQLSLYFLAALRARDPWHLGLHNSQANGQMDYADENKSYAI